MKYKKALLMGKFMPPHIGHEYLINFASLCAETLYVLIDNLNGQTMSVEDRYQILCTQFASKTNIKFLKQSFPTPQEPSDCTSDAQFYLEWKNIIHSHVTPDVVIASMDYVVPVAQMLGIDYIKLDVARESIHISATEIRANINDKWDYLMSSAKPYFLKKVCLIGPESTGKSSAATILAQRYNTTYVPEHAKNIIKSNGGIFELKDAPSIALMQYNSEAALSLSPLTRNLLFIDSCALTTKIWCQMLFNHYPPELDGIIARENYNLTLLCAPNTSWRADSHRLAIHSSLEFRRAMFEMFKQQLEQLGRLYLVIDEAEYSQRIASMKQHISKHLNISAQENINDINDRAHY